MRRCTGSRMAGERMSVYGSALVKVSSVEVAVWAGDRATQVRRQVGGL